MPKISTVCEATESDIPGEGASGSAAMPAPARVLVADDNADMRDYVSRLLASRYRVESAGDGQSALERIMADPPDLVLTNVGSPKAARSANSGCRQGWTEQRRKP